jgi:hypothetical protein
VIIQLIQLRDALRSADASQVEAFLQHAQEVRRQWWVLRQKGEWEPRSEKDVTNAHRKRNIGRMFGFRPKKDKK